MNALELIRYLQSPEGAKLLKFLVSLDGVDGQFRVADALALLERVNAIGQRSGQPFAMVIKVALDDYEERLRLIGW